MRPLTHGIERFGRVALRVTALLTLLVFLFAIPATADAATGGGLKQLAGGKGCIVDEGTVTAGCEEVRAMQNVTDVVLSPGGENVYVSSFDKDAIAVFDRNSSTGELTQKNTITGCITSNATTAGTDTCNLIPNSALVDVNAMAISPDGKNLYTVTNTGATSVFDRADDGTLTFDETNGCCQGSGAGTSITVSPDGASVYVAGPFYSGIVVWHRRNMTAGPNLGDISFGNCWGSPNGCSIAAQNLSATPSALAVTPDNKEVLVASAGNDAVLGWDRETTGGNQGSLTPSATPSRCISESDLGATCQVRDGAITPLSLVALDDDQIFVGGEQALTTIVRNPSNNNLTPDGGNCFGYPTSAFTSCTPLPGGSPYTFYPTQDLIGLPDHSSLYFGTEAISTNGSIYSFTRTGSTVTQKPGALGCLNPTAIDGCATFRQGNAIRAMAAANNSRHVYAVGNSRLFSFAVDRPPVCQNVGANTAHNTSVAVHLSCSDPDGDAVSYEKLTDPPKGTLGGVQGDTINYNPLTGSIGSDSFSYRAVAAGAGSDPATATVNVAAPPAPPPPAATLIPSTVGNNWAAFKAYTKVITLSAKKLPAGASVLVACKTRKKSQQKKRCPFKSQTFTAPAGKAQANLAKPFRKKKLPIGTRLTITITAPTYIGKVFTYTMRKRAIPLFKLQCLAPGANKPGKC